MKQNFNSKELVKYLKKGELIRSEIDKEDLIYDIDSIELEILNETFEFDFKNKYDFYLVEDLTQKLLLRKLNDNIKRIYKDEQANRRFIIQQVKTLLSEDCPFWIIKTDIKSFYESVDRTRILTKIKDDAMLSYYSNNLLKKIFLNPIIETDGLPRGLNISSSLSELYLRKFDRWIQRSSGVYFYARFVDDIIIFLSDKKSAQNLFNEMELQLQQLCNLNINYEKTELIEGANFKVLEKKYIRNVKHNNLEYLGYKFYLVPKTKKRELKVSIADKKVKKIKTRVAKAYLDYIKNSDFNLLLKRIKFLTGNYGIKKSNDGSVLKAGIYYNYPHLNNLDVLNELNSFHRKILYSKRNNFGNKLSSKLTLANRELLKKYCFINGFQKKTYKSFSYVEMGQIIKCW